MSMLTRWKQRKADKQLFWRVRNAIADSPQVAYVKVQQLAFPLSKLESLSGLIGDHFWYFEPYDCGGITVAFCARKLGYRKAALALLHEYGHHLQWLEGRLKRSSQVHIDWAEGRKTAVLAACEQDAWLKAVMLWVGQFGQVLTYSDLAFLLENYCTYWRWEDAISLLTFPVVPDTILE